MQKLIQKQPKEQIKVYQMNKDGNFELIGVENASVSDCQTGFLFDNDYNVCWLNETNKSTYGMRYDDNGNLISGFGMNYSYNGFNWLVNVSGATSGILVAEYWYDDSGERVKSIVYSGEENETTYYFDNFVQIVNSSGVFNETYYYYYDKLVGLRSSDGSVLFYHPDHLGSSTLVTDINGAVVSELEYEPFGSLVDDSNERYTYTGQEQDVESGLMYYGARYYNPDLAKFVQADPVIGDIYNPQDLNKYAYVRNNPYKYTDPEGEWVNILVQRGLGIIIPYLPKAIEILVPAAIRQIGFWFIDRFKPSIRITTEIPDGYRKSTQLSPVSPISSPLLIDGSSSGRVGGGVDTDVVSYREDLSGESSQTITSPRIETPTVSKPSQTKSSYVSRTTTAIKTTVIETGTKVVETGIKIVETGIKAVGTGAKKLYKKAKFW